MNLLFIAPRIKTRSQIRNFSGVWSWYLEQEFKRRGISIRFDAPLHEKKRKRSDIVDHYRNLDLDGIDHIVALGTRYFDRVPKACGNVLMERCCGAVVQIHDSGRDQMPCHATFTLRSDRCDERNHYIGWAADHELLRPRQVRGEFRILVDHPDYGVGRRDNTERVVEECARFARSKLWRGRYSSVSLRRLVDGAIEDFDEGSAVWPYGRSAVSFEECCEEYSKAHVFMVTHPESVGLTVLETAMAGALTVAPAGFIQEDRLATVRHLTYDGSVPWREVLDSVDIKASRAMARENTWAKVAARMLVYFKNFSRRKR